MADDLVSQLLERYLSPMNTAGMDPAVRAQVQAAPKQQIPVPPMPTLPQSPAMFRPQPVGPPAPPMSAQLPTSPQLGGPARPPINVGAPKIPNYGPQQPAPFTPSPLSQGSSADLGGSPLQEQQPALPSTPTTPSYQATDQALNMPAELTPSPLNPVRHNRLVSLLRHIVGS